MKAIELAIYTPEGQIKVDTGVYKTDIDKTADHFSEDILLAMAVRTP